MSRLNDLSGYRCPAYQQFPGISLYKDQVISFLNQFLAPVYSPEPNPVTSAMINNYVKLKVLSAPEHKKYSRDQVVCLYVIFLLKQVLSMEEIRQLLVLEFPQDQVEDSYRRFCAQMEGELSRLSDGTAPLPSSGHPLMDASIRSFVYKRYAVSLLELAADDQAM